MQWRKKILGINAYFDNNILYLFNRLIRGREEDDDKWFLCNDNISYYLHYTPTFHEHDYLYFYEKM